MQASYARGPDFTLSVQTILQMLAQTAAKFPEREALVVLHQQIRLTWRELAGQVERTARGRTSRFRNMSASSIRFP